MAASRGAGAANDAAVNNEPADQPASVVQDAEEAVERAEQKVAKQREHQQAAEDALEQARQDLEDVRANAAPEDEEN